MGLHGSFNAPQPAPGSSRGGERRTECCARCRRGVKGFGELPCGYEGKCPNDCHKTKEAERG